MTPETAARLAANNLIQAFKRLRLVDRSANSDSLGLYNSRRAPSERWFQLDVDCIDSIEKALLKLGDTVGTYPREKLFEAITDIVIAVRDTETPVQRAHEGLAQGVLELLARSGCLHGGETNVCIADTQLASMAVAQCFCGILDDPKLKSIRTLSELLTSIGGKNREEVVKQPPAKPLNARVLGDAGEHYALSQFAFTGLPGTKMPDNWEGYDLAVETAAGLARVSVKVRSEGDGWKSGSWFSLDDRKQCDWIVFIFKPREGALRSWVMPIGVANENASNPGPDRVDPWMRDISWSKLNKLPLSAFEDNWGMTRHDDVI